MSDQAADEDKEPILEDPESRWPALVAVAAAGGLYAALPQYLAIGPRWLLPAIGCALVIPSLLARRLGYHLTTIVLGHVLSGILTAFELWSLGILVVALPSHKEPPIALLRSGGCLWVTNIVVFGLWYWRLDAGGPHEREQRSGHEEGAFLFPQMTLDGPAGCESNGRPWSPRFIDYLFLAFNTSTAFSPTDVPVLSRWAKVLGMIQSVISLTVVIILIGHGVNVL